MNDNSILSLGDEFNSEVNLGGNEGNNAADEGTNTNGGNTDTSDGGTDGGAGTDGAAAGGNNDDLPFLSVTTDDGDVSFTAEEAGEAVKKGLLYDSISGEYQRLKEHSPIFDTLDFLAVTSGKDIKTYVEGLVKSSEQAVRDEVEKELYGSSEETIETVINARLSAAKQKYEQTLSERKTAAETEKQTKTNNRNSEIADAFLRLKKENPEMGLSEYKDLPASVKKEVEKGGDLEKVLYKHFYSENKKISAQKAAEEKAKQNSTGSANGVKGDGEGKNAAIDALMQGLWK